MPARTASSTTYWIAGLSRSGSISFGCALVAGQEPGPEPGGGDDGLADLRHALLWGLERGPVGSEAYPVPPPCIPPGRDRRSATLAAMPTYEYACTSCGQHIEVFQRFTEDPLTTCGVCGGPLRKVFHPAGIVFKGSGFYATDSRAKSGSSSTKDEWLELRTRRPSSGSILEGRPTDSVVGLVLVGLRLVRAPSADSSSSSLRTARRRRLAVEGRAHERRADRGVRRLGLLLVPRGRGDGRHRDALRGPSAPPVVGEVGGVPGRVHPSARRATTSSRRTGSTTGRTCGR